LGAKIAPDLWLPGFQRALSWHPVFPYGHDWSPLSSNPLTFDDNCQAGANTSIERLQECLNLYSDAAQRAKAVGFDFIHLAGHFGFLIGQFLSPAFNKRTDRYGGNLENRLRFPLEIIRVIKDKVGDALPIIFRMSADEFWPGASRLRTQKSLQRGFRMPVSTH